MSPMAALFSNWPGQGLAPSCCFPEGPALPIPVSIKRQEGVVEHREFLVLSCWKSAHLHQVKKKRGLFLGGLFRCWGLIAAGQTLELCFLPLLLLLFHLVNGFLKPWWGGDALNRAT